MFFVFDDYFLKNSYNNHKKDSEKASLFNLSQFSN